MFLPSRSSENQQNVLRAPLFYTFLTKFEEADHMHFVGPSLYDTISLLKAHTDFIYAP